VGYKAGSRGRLVVAGFRAKGLSDHPIVGRNRKAYAVKSSFPSPRTRAPFVFGAVACAGVMLAGCVGSPTYGTGKSANAQLVEDVTGILSLGPRDRPEVAYNPRPELVQPASLEVLPTPQQGVTEGEGSAWPESPEQRLARIRAEATENRDDPNYRPNVAGVVDTQFGRNSGRARGGDGAPDPLAVDLQSRDEINRRLVERRQGVETQRKYLSEPPLDYRQPTATAPVGDVGEDEWRKERRLRQASGDRSWRDYIPGL
jgi:hypothetical protein